jgi:cardiolipin synthase
MLNFGKRNQFPSSVGNDVRLLLSGGQILCTLRTMIENAQVSVHFEIYAWADDVTGRELLTRLQDAQARGVKVRGVVDSFGCWEFLPMLKASGLDLRFYHPLGLSLPWRLWRRRNHRKLLIADGARALVGSANWTNEYNDEIPPKYYRDLGLELQGPSVEHLERDFRLSWCRVGGPLHDLLVTQAPPPTGPGWHCGVPVQVVSSLHHGGRNLRRHLILSLGQLELSAIIANAYFIPDPRFLRMLMGLARRGVKVDLIAPGDSDHGFAQAASRATFGRMLRAGVGIWERQAQVFHAKVALLDRDLVLVGTANLDSASFRHNLELNLLVRSESLGDALQEALGEDKALSTRWSQEAWAARSALQRSYQRFAYLFWRWL